MYSCPCTIMYVVCKDSLVCIFCVMRWSVRFWFATAFVDYVIQIGISSASKFSNFPCHFAYSSLQITIFFYVCHAIHILSPLSFFSSILVVLWASLRQQCSQPFISPKWSSVHDHHLSPSLAEIICYFVWWWGEIFVYSNIRILKCDIAHLTETADYCEINTSFFLALLKLSWSHTLL